MNALAEQKTKKIENGFLGVRIVGCLLYFVVWNLIQFVYSYTLRLSNYYLCININTYDAMPKGRLIEFIGIK